MVSWYRELVFLCSGNEGSLHLCFHQIGCFLSFFFLGHLYSCQAGTPGIGGEGKEKKAVVKLLWQLGGISDLLLGRFLDFNSCFLMAGNERIYEGLRDAHYSSRMHVLLI